MLPIVELGHKVKEASSLQRNITKRVVPQSWNLFPFFLNLFLSA